MLTVTQGCIMPLEWYTFTGDPAAGGRLYGAVCFLRETIMKASKKIMKMFQTQRDDKEIERWFISLAPLGLAFIFFFVFMSAMEMPNKDIVYTVGGAAGFTGLQTYWIARGWNRGDGTTILLGVGSIAFTVAIAWMYVYIFRNGSM